MMLLLFTTMVDTLLPLTEFLTFLGLISNYCFFPSINFGKLRLLWHSRLSSFFELVLKHHLGGAAVLALFRGSFR